MIPLLAFIAYVINLYEYVVIAAVILSWLIGFNVINGYNPFVRTLWGFITAATEPFLKPIRQIIPQFGGIDISPVILLLACLFLRSVVIHGWLIPLFT
jgi:YggT family protein